MWEILFLLGALILGGVVGSEELVLENDQIERADGDAAVGEIEHRFEEPECLAANMWSLPPRQPSWAARLSAYISNLP